MTKGKNYSGNNIGQRRKHDAYDTPKSMILQLLENIELDPSKSVLDPCCANDAMGCVLSEVFKDTVKYDLFIGEDNKSFFEESKRYDYIITNPPFSKWNDFVLHAKKIARKKVCFLGKIDFLTGIERYNQSVYSGLESIYIFTRKPNLAEDFYDSGMRYKCGIDGYAWYVWDKLYIGEPIIRWI